MAHEGNTNESCGCVVNADLSITRTPKHDAIRGKDHDADLRIDFLRDQIAALVEKAARDQAQVERVMKVYAKQVEKIDALVTLLDEAYEFIRGTMDGGKSDLHGSTTDLLARRIADAVVAHRPGATK